MSIATQSYFLGDWQMVRVIENIPDGAIGEVWGECRFTPDGYGLTCRESGVMRFQGADYRAARVSLWRFPSPGEIDVRYEDDRPFHSFRAETPEAEHLCGADLYRVSYDFQPGHWLSVWRVSGPKKDYVMRTRYHRLDRVNG